MSMEQVPETVATDKKTEALSEDVQTEGVPKELFDAWLRANIIHPQAPYEIVSHVALELFTSDTSLQTFSHSKLSEYQLERIVAAMAKAHAAKGVATPRVKETNDAKRIAQELWTDLKRDVLLLGAIRLKPDFLDGTEKEQGILSQPEEVLYSVDFLEKTFAKGSIQKEILTEFFNLSVEALETEEIQALEKKRRETLDRFSKKTGEEKKLAHATLRLINRDAQEKILAHVLQHSQHTLSDTIKKALLSRF